MLKLLKIEWIDFKAIFYIILAIIPSLFLRKKKHGIWLMCERKDHAEDNGWILYHWIRKHHPEQQAYFVLDENAVNFSSNDKNMIAWGSFRHYVYYLASDINVKAMFASPTPAIRVFSYYNRWFHKNIKIAYIRHGIVKDGCEHHCYQYLKVQLFICGALPEYEYLLENAGYPEGYLKYTGLARYDDLIEKQYDGGYLLIMPTWRRYLCESTHQSENERAFLESKYYKTYQALLNSKALADLLKEKNVKARFGVHAEFRRFAHLFKTNIPNLEFVKENESIHDLLIGASLLITDYSSVFFDVAYMYKPIVFFHFDYEEFRKKHLNEGYFSYERDGFGEITHNEKDLVDAINKCYVDNCWEMPKLYKERVNKFFPQRDSNNSQRIFNAIKELEGRDTNAL